MTASSRSLPAFLMACFACSAACVDSNDDDIVISDRSPSTGNDAAVPGLDGAFPTVDSSSMDSSMNTLIDADMTSTPDAGEGGVSTLMSFFVSSDTSKTGNLGGLAGADARCQRLAAAVGEGAKSWRAYLSVERNLEAGGSPTNARDRIGSGPWYNARGELIAADLASLLARKGDPALFLDEHGNTINGQWNGLPPNEHDVLTGSDEQGLLLRGFTCQDWTSSSELDKAQVGHSDGLGPNKNGAPPYNSWNASHESGGCHDTSLRGGAGRIYCFARN
jgi:hypothetical protein